ncbi:MAG TPA: hypothetical protein VM284_07535 [Candidatus Limnocylindria bacterium]|nr:hypothetical protein [Candidatus Limnocylindria bacterium]
MPDVAKILDLVAEGKLSAQDADEILGALNSRESIASPEAAATPDPTSKKTTHLRIEVTDGGRHVVNLRVPLNIAGWASNFLPGLSDQDSDRIRGAVASGNRGTILDITDKDGSRVLITSE